MLYTLFTGGYLAAYTDNVDDPSQSRWSQQVDGGTLQNVITKRVEDINLGLSETRTITMQNWPAAAPYEWAWIVIRCVGEARINLAGKDLDNATAISSKHPVYGTSVMPGILILSSYNVATFQIEGLAANTQVQIFVGVAVEDDDARFTSYA